MADEATANFMAFTGCADPSTASFYLDAAGGNLEMAVGNFMDQGGGGGGGGGFGAAAAADAAMPDATAGDAEMAAALAAEHATEHECVRPAPPPPKKKGAART